MEIEVHPTHLENLRWPPEKSGCFLWKLGWSFLVENVVLPVKIGVFPVETEVVPVEIGVHLVDLGGVSCGT